MTLIFAVIWSNLVMCVMDGSIPSRSAIYRENTAVELQNFAIVAQVSIDTAAQHCEVLNSVAVIL